MTGFQKVIRYQLAEGGFMQHNILSVLSLVP